MLQPLQSLVHRRAARPIAVRLRRVLRNGAALGRGIYLHFILVLDKPGASPAGHGATP